MIFYRLLFLLAIFLNMGLLYSDNGSPMLDVVDDDPAFSKYRYAGIDTLDDVIALDQSIIFFQKEAALFYKQHIFFGRGFHEFRYFLRHIKMVLAERLDTMVNPEELSIFLLPNRLEDLRSDSVIVADCTQVFQVHVFKIYKKLGYGNIFSARESFRALESIAFQFALALSGCW